jgi:polyisoprenoid-binding protein YceI
MNTPAEKINTKTKWTMDIAHSEIAFAIRHLMIANIKGSFKLFDASIYTTAQDFTTAAIDLWIEASSISTGDPKRDEHLKSEEFLDTENHKQISFVSETVGKLDKDGKYELWGELTIKGITRNVKLDVLFGGIVKDPWGNEKAGFTVSGKLKRSDWGLNWNAILEAGGVLVGEEVVLSCEIELINSGQKDLTLELVETNPSDKNWMR